MARALAGVRSVARAGARRRAVARAGARGAGRGESTGGAGASVMMWEKGGVWGLGVI